GFSGMVAPQIRQSAQQRRDSALRLDARKLGAEAEVYAPAEGQRTDVGTGNIEAVRPVRIYRRFAVGRAQQAEHRLTFRNFLAAEVIDVLQRHPARRLNRRVVT